MGTSKGISTPAGGGWTAVKKQITSAIGGSATASVDRIIGGVIAAAGGLGSSIGRTGSRGGGTGGGGGGGGGTGGGTGRVSIGGTVTGLAGFGADVRTNGLDGATTRLGLTDLRGRPAVEVITRVAEHLAETADGPQADLLAMALRDAILECAAIETDGTYEDLDNALQSYFDREGIEGLVEGFLSRFVFDRVWAWIETHAQEKSDAIPDTQSLESAVESACREHVHGLIDDVKAEGVFDATDWFGVQGVELGQQIVSTLEFRLDSLSSKNE